MGMCGTGERVLGSENGQADNLLSGSLVVQRSDVAESHRDSTLSPYGNPKWQRHRGQTRGETRINTPSHD